MWYVLWQLMANVIYEKNYFDSVLVYIWNIVAIAKWFRICLSGVQFFVCKSSKWNKTKHITNIPLWKKVFQWPFLKNKDNWRRSRKNKWLHVFKRKYSDVILKCVIFLFFSPFITSHLPMELYLSRKITEISNNFIYISFCFIWLVLVYIAYFRICFRLNLSNGMIVAD